VVVDRSLVVVVQVVLSMMPHILQLVVGLLSLSEQVAPAYHMLRAYLEYQEVILY
jgi:hypothetical protein